MSKKGLKKKMEKNIDILNYLTRLDCMENECFEFIVRDLEKIVLKTRNKLEKNNKKKMKELKKLSEKTFKKIPRKTRKVMKKAFLNGYNEKLKGVDI